MRAKAFDFGPTYFGTHLSEQIAETPEGFLICRNAIIGRSGYQTYLVSDIADPTGLLKGFAPSDEIQIWRDPAEVFSTQTMASFEGKSFTVNHPETLLDPETDRDHSVGHIQNVRKGPEPLESGDWPLLADVIVKDSDAIRQIKGGLRELSCGYGYTLAKEGERFDQRNIWGNHLALVPKGRAGHEARINDSLPSKGYKVKNPFRHIFGLGVAAYAKDASPEELTEAMDEMNRRAKALDADPEPAKPATKDADPAMDKKAMDRKKLHDALDAKMDAADAEEAAKGQEADDAMDTLKNMFADRAEEHPEDCDCEKCKGASDEGQTVEATDGEVTSPEPTLPSSDVPESQFDSAEKLITSLRPFIAKTKDARVKKAFDTAVTSLNAAKSKEGTASRGTYAQFSSATRAVAGDKSLLSGESHLQKQAREFDEMYSNEMKTRGGHFKAKK